MHCPTAKNMFRALPDMSRVVQVHLPALLQMHIYLHCSSGSISSVNDNVIYYNTLFMHDSVIVQVCMAVLGHPCVLP